ncbi:hypothetical protein NPIL_687182 [Nephila pilipes]|uniref:Uncharacterized protein n=1 Tax=Nephila pilipes TaxID=299642 RepID=A0A8X6Q1Y5_NEPPI|nr:hypothetical protein NPIL_687182 [Nephila pilipes]
MGYHINFRLYKNHSRLQKKKKMSKQPHISEQLETRVENSKENSDSLFKIGIKESNDPMYGFDKLYEELLLKNEIDAGLKQVLENVDKQRTNRENVSNRIHVAKRKPMLQRSFVKPRYKVKVEHSEKKELMEQIKYMVQKNLMVKKKLGPKRTYMAERIHIVTLGGKILCFTDSSTEIRRLSQKKFSKLSKEMKKNIIKKYRNEVCGSYQKS